MKIKVFIGNKNYDVKRGGGGVVWRSPTLYRTATWGKGLASHNTWTCANHLKYVDDVCID